MKTAVSLFIIAIFASANIALAQVSINDNGQPPDPSAMLDVQAADKGFLLPRLDYYDLPYPAAPGLMVFVTANGPEGDNLIYLYNGSDWVMLHSTDSSVGSMMEGGVVFWYDEYQGFGLVSAMFDQGASEWGCFGEEIGFDAWNVEIGMGDANTGAIVSACNEESFAAKICDDLELNGYTDWFLPSRDELYEMYLYKDAIGGYSNNLYWSSTETEIAPDPSEMAWIVGFNNGFQGWTTKSASLALRCIRKYYF
jgi:hypothetical protein